MDLVDFQAEREFLVGIDSDGCVFDSMELKHKECFIPAFIKHYGLQGVSKYAREASEFVNLYSKSRGVNRFPGLVEQLDWLRRRPEVKSRGIDVPNPEGLRRWIPRETKLGNPALQRAVEETGDPDLRRALEWSLAVNHAISEMVRGVPPFPYVRECLERLADEADMLVVSATPGEALSAEWQEHSSVPRRKCSRWHGTIHPGIRSWSATLQATIKRPRLTVAYSFRSTPGRKKQAGNGSSRKAPSGSSTAPSLATINPNCSKNSINYYRIDRRGRCERS
jgi:hypothetical protein